MGEERLPKKTVIKAKEFGSNNLLDESETIMRKHNYMQRNRSNAGDSKTVEKVSREEIKRNSKQRNT